MIVGLSFASYTTVNVPLVESVSSGPMQSPFGFNSASSLRFSVFYINFAEASSFDAITLHRVPIAEIKISITFDVVTPSRN